MRPSFTLGALAALAACNALSNETHKVPVELGKPEDNSLALTHVTSGPTLEKRVGYNNWWTAAFVKTPIALIGGFAITEPAVHQRMQQQCTEFKNGMAWDTAAVCVRGVVWTAITFATHAVGIFTTVTAFLALPGGQAAREGGTGGYELNGDQIRQLQQQMPNALANMTLHKATTGDTELQDAWSLHFPHDTGMYQHVTNGTHGYVRMQPHTTESKKMKRGDKWTYSFGPGVAGIKLSYTNPCNKEVLDNSKRASDLLYGAVTDLTNWMSKNPRDGYILEIYETQFNDDILQGTLIFEESGFGKNYEGWPYTPYMGCKNSKFCPYGSDDRGI